MTMDFRSATALPPHGSVSLPMMGHGMNEGVSSLLASTPPPGASSLFGLYHSSTNGLPPLPNGSQLKPPPPSTPSLSTLTPLPPTSTASSNGQRMAISASSSLHRGSPLTPWSAPNLGPAPNQTSLAQPPTTVGGGGGGTSSFAAALRNLAKNATANTLEGEKAKRASVGPMATTPGSVGSMGLGQPPIGTIAPTQLIASTPDTATQASLMDVRKGFSSSQNSHFSPQSDFGTNVTPSSTSSILSLQKPSQSLVSSGFQPYKPDLSLGKGHPALGSAVSGIPSLSSVVSSYSHPSLGMHPNYAAALMASGYHPGLFAGSPLSAAYGLEAEAWYRAQLERYAIATGLAQPGRAIPPSQSFPGLYPGSPALAPTISTPVSCSLPSPGTPNQSSPTFAAEPKKDRDRQEREKRKHTKKDEESVKEKVRDRSSSRTSKPSTPPTSTTTPTTATESSLSALLTAPPVTSTLPNVASSLSNYPLHPALASYFSPLSLTGNCPAPPNTSWEGPQMRSAPAMVSMATQQSAVCQPPKVESLVDQAPNPLLNGGGCHLLPTKPLDISEVKKVSEIKEEVKPEANRKRKFVRPFEDDFASSSNSIGQREKCAKLSDQDTKESRSVIPCPLEPIPAPRVAAHAEETATLHYNDKVVCVNPFSCSDLPKVELENVKDENSNETTISAISNIIQVDKNNDVKAPAPSPPTSIKKEDDEHFVKPNQEVLTKEKLKYLRYFRLGTHRKKNDHDAKFKVEENAKDAEDDLEDKNRSSDSPTLPLPNIDAGAQSQHQAADSQGKSKFMTSLDLWQVPSEEVQEKEDEWKTILEERLARTPQDTRTKSLVYLSRLRDLTPTSNPPPNRTTFLHPKIESKKPTILTLEQQNTKLAQALVNGKPQSTTTACPVVPSLPLLPLTQNHLPNINFSSLMPLPYQDMKAVDASKSPPMPFLNGLTTTGNGTLSPLPPVPSPDFGGHNSSAPSPGGLTGKKQKVATWVGVEAVILSFKKHLNDSKSVRKKLEKRLQDLQKEAIQQRNKVDSLSTEMAGLARNQKDLSEKLTEVEHFREICKEVLQALSFPTLQNITDNSQT
ncbi:uncharacterized protein LOC131884600 isoform X2 [Tigriopus californicus]|uniref:uncharacterized protein LOC131884600 isoform X2 n=1 Tax=Tigriopus californicus TaxID=6832 RepID=UPI0027DAAA81|nr:uncharacterized protein LOC131884600 isoform X2 [Tigriopus californicus]